MPTQRRASSSTHPHHRSQGLVCCEGLVAIQKGYARASLDPLRWWRRLVNTIIFNTFKLAMGCAWRVPNLIPFDPLIPRRRPMHGPDRAQGTTRGYRSRRRRHGQSTGAITTLSICGGCGGWCETEGRVSRSLLDVSPGLREPSAPRKKLINSSMVICGVGG